MLLSGSPDAIGKISSDTTLSTPKKISSSAPSAVALAANNVRSFTGSTLSTA